MAKEGVSNSLGVFAVVSGVLSIVLPIASLPFGFVGGFVFAILGLVCGIIQAVRGRNAWSTAAIVLSVIGILVNVFVLYALVTVVQGAISQYQALAQSGALNAVSAGGANA